MNEYKADKVTLTFTDSITAFGCVDVAIAFDPELPADIDLRNTKQPAIYTALLVISALTAGVTGRKDGGAITSIPFKGMRELA